MRYPPALPGDSKGFDLCGGHTTLHGEDAAFVPSPMQGEGWGGGRAFENGHAVFQAHYPHPNLPPARGKELFCRLGRPVVIAAFEALTIKAPGFAGGYLLYKKYFSGIFADVCANSSLTSFSLHGIITP